MKKSHAFTVSFLALSLAAACGSGEGESKAATKGSSAGEADKADEPPPEPSVRTELHTYRSLIEESARAELDVGGLFIDFGTADQHKYTRGSWNSGWSDPVQSGEHTVARGDSKRSRLEGMFQQPVTEIVLKARSEVAGQVAHLLIDGKTVGKAELGSEWGVHRVAIKEPPEPGLHKFRIVWGKDGDPRGEVDWMWMAAEAGAEPPGILPRAIPVRVGGEPRRALISPTARRYSFYLDLPEKAQLVFDHGAPSKVPFAVRVQVDGEETKELWRGDAADTWDEQAIDLSAYAGKAIRLELATEGDGGGWGEPEIMVPEPPEQVAASKKAQGVIVFMIDTLRAEAFSPFGDSVAKTPVYDELVKEATVFQNAYNNENWTKPSVATTLTGLYPTTHTTKTDGAKLPEEILMVPQHLQKHGFKTGGFIANGYVSGAFGFEKGWDAYTNYIREKKATESEHVYEDAIEWLTEHKNDKFFLFLQTIDPHVVYRVDDKYTSMYFDGEYDGFLGSTIHAEEQVAMSRGKQKYTERDLNWLKAVYWGETTYHDEQMGIFLEKLRELGIMDDVALIVMNDHGEELGEHGRFGHGHSLYEDMIRSPLTFRFPAVFEGGRTFTEIVEHVDITPTVLDLLGAPPMPNVDGTSLMPLVKGQPNRRPYYALTEFLDGHRSIRVGTWKMIRSRTGGTDLYDLIEDRAEENDLAGERPIAERFCQVYMGEGLGMPQKRARLEDIAARRKFDPAKANITPEVRKDLEALGYFGD